MENYYIRHAHVTFSNDLIAFLKFKYPYPDGPKCVQHAQLQEESWREDINEKEGNKKSSKK